VPKSAGKEAEPTDTKENAESEAGKALAAKSPEQIESAINALKAGIVALEELRSAANSQGDEGEKESDGITPKQRSTPAVSTETFDDWKFGREVLRAIVTSGSEALERFNKSAREQSRRK
jgi:hypothetical protein